MKSLLLVDVSHIFWSAWHAGADKELSFAFDATVSKVNQLRNGYDHIAICVDSPPYWRKEIHPEYKANREAAPPAAIEQFRRTKERLRKDGFLLWEARGFEADDIIATAVARSGLHGIDAIDIASADKDLMQLISDAERIAMVSTRDGKRIDEAAVREKFGVGVELVVDSLALQGDSSDNIKGVKGIGPKTAAELLGEFGSLERLLQQAHMVKQPAKRFALQECAEAARLARKLVTLRTDAPIDFAELFQERIQEPVASDTDNYDGFDGDDAEDDIPISPPPKTPAPAAGASSTSDQPRAHTPNGSGGVGASSGAPPPTPAADAPLEAEFESKSTAIVPVEWSLSLEPRSLKTAGELAIRLYNSRLYSKFSNVEAIFAVIIRGRELGLGALTALDCFHVVEGKPCLHAHLIVAKAKAHPDCEYFQFVSGSAQYAEYVTKNRNNPEPTRLRYTIDEAKTAGLLKPPREGKEPGNWFKRPAEMLRKTCATQLARIEYPEAAMGLYSLEEMGVDAA